MSEPTTDEYEITVREIDGTSENGLGWESTEFDTIRHIEREEDEFLVTPFKVEEGVVKCRCGSWKTFSYPKLTRSLDEPYSTFALCMECGKNWVIAR
jgi:DNA-directed RNA polymerase subunit M/transcription elongation factor TFIIS